MDTMSADTISKSSIYSGNEDIQTDDYHLMANGTSSSNDPVVGYSNHSYVSDRAEQVLDSTPGTATASNGHIMDNQEDRKKGESCDEHVEEVTTVHITWSNFYCYFNATYHVG